MMKPKIAPALLCMLLFVLAACVDYNDAVAPVTLNVTVERPASFTQGADLAGKAVTLTLNGNQQTALTDAQGKASFVGIAPDVYTISTSWQVSAAEYAAFTGDDVATDGASVTGSVNAQVVSADVSLTLPTHVAVNRSVVIGKVYYAGSKDMNNKNYLAGRYIELFNQSDSVVDVAGMYVALLESESTPAYTLANLHEKFADSVVLAKQIFRIPADKAYQVLPGETVLLANSAVDHVPSAPQENNLTTANFEAKDATGRTRNNPDVPALTLVYSAYTSISQMNLLQGGPCGVALFRTAEDVSAWGKTYAYGKMKGMEFVKIPVRYITDAVDILKRGNQGVDINTKRLYPNLDAGYTNIKSASGYTGELVVRKVARRVGQRLILQDTNNSSNDFHVSTTLKIRQYEE